MALAKADIIELANQELGFPQKKSTEMVEQLIEIIKTNLAWRNQNRRRSRNLPERNPLKRRNKN